MDRTSACPHGRGAANLVAASRMRLRHRIEPTLSKLRYPRTACLRFTDQSQTRAAHAWTLACAAMRCLVSNLSLQWLKSVCLRLPLDQRMRELPAGALNRPQAKFLYILSTRRFGNNGDVRTSNSMHSDGRTKHRCQRRGCEVVNAGSPACEVRVTAEHRASASTTKTRPARHL